MRLLLLALGAFAALALSCATTSNGPPASCGDACARLVCPSAFVCVTDGKCVGRCQPEGMKPGVF
jgi:hypothetical protein